MKKSKTHCQSVLDQNHAKCRGFHLTQKTAQCHVSVKCRNTFLKTPRPNESEVLESSTSCWCWYRFICFCILKPIPTVVTVIQSRPGWTFECIGVPAINHLVLTEHTSWQKDSTDHIARVGVELKASVAICWSVFRDPLQIPAQVNHHKDFLSNKNNDPNGGLSESWIFSWGRIKILEMIHDLWRPSFLILLTLRPTCKVSLRFWQWGSTHFWQVLLFIQCACAKMVFLSRFKISYFPFSTTS